MRQRAPRRPPPSRARSARDGSVALVREGGRGRGRGRAVALGDNFEDIPGYVGARCRRASGCGRAWRQFRGHTRLCGCAVSSGVGLRSRLATISRTYPVMWVRGVVGRRVAVALGDNFEDIPGYVGARCRRASGCGRVRRQFRGHTRLCGCAVSSGVGLRSRLATISRTYPVMWVRGVVGRRVAVACGDNFEDIPGYVGARCRRASGCGRAWRQFRGHTRLCGCAVSSGVGLRSRAATISRTYPVMWVRGVVGRRVAVALGDNFEDIPGYVGARCRRASGCGRAWRQFRGHTRLCGCAASSGVGLRSRAATISRTYPVMWVRGVVGRRVAVALGDNFEDIPGYVGARCRRASGCGRAWRQFRGHTRLCGCAASSGVGLRSRLATISRTYPVMWVRGVVGRRVAVALGDNFEDIPGYVGARCRRASGCGRAWRQFRGHTRLCGCAVSSRVALRSRRRAKTPLRGGPGRARSGRVWGPGGARSREAASTAPCGSAVRRGGQPKALQRSFGFAVDELPYSGPSGSPWTNCPTAVLRVRRGRTGARTGRCTPGLLPWCRRRSGGRGTSCRRDR